MARVFKFPSSFYYEENYWPRDDKNSQKTFYNAKNAATMIAIKSALRVTTTVNHSKTSAV